MRVIAHRPDKRTVEEYDSKERQAREDHSLDKGEPIVFLEVKQGDASDFAGDLARARATRSAATASCAATAPAIPNAIAALLSTSATLTGRIPDAYFGWTEGNPLGLRPALPGPRGRATRRR